MTRNTGNARQLQGRCSDRHFSILQFMDVSSRREFLERHVVKVNVRQTSSKSQYSGRQVVQVHFREDRLYKSTIQKINRASLLFGSYFSFRKFNMTKYEISVAVHSWRNK